jgi:hypothetical protein
VNLVDGVGNQLQANEVTKEPATRAEVYEALKPGKESQHSGNSQRRRPSVRKLKHHDDGREANSHEHGKLHSTITSAEVERKGSLVGSVLRR